VPRSFGGYTTGIHVEVAIIEFRDGVGVTVVGDQHGLGRW